MTAQLRRSTIVYLFPTFCLLSVLSVGGFFGCSAPVGDAPQANTTETRDKEKTQLTDSSPSPPQSNSPPQPTLALHPASTMLAAANVGATAKIKNITFDDIKFDMKKTESFKRSMLTDEIEKLHGQTIRIRGYMLPSFQQKGIKQFVLVRDNMECCFGPGAALFDCIMVEMEEGESATFSVRPITVEGEFRIKPFKGPDGKYLAIYYMVGHNVSS